MSEETRMTILNLTQHKATPEQLQAGVVELPKDMKEQLVSLLTFSSVPSKSDLESTARSIAKLATDYNREFAVQKDFSNAQRAAFDLDLYAPGLNSFNNITMFKVMIGGAPFFMSYLEKALEQAKITPVYAFSERVSVDVEKEDGSVVKTAVFKHLGFVGL